jgi:hypothetical protein
MEFSVHTATQRQNSAIIVADVRRFAHESNTDGILGTHRDLREQIPVFTPRRESRSSDAT